VSGNMSGDYVQGECPDHEISIVARFSINLRSVIFLEELLTAISL